MILMQMFQILSMLSFISNSFSKLIINISGIEYSDAEMQAQFTLNQSRAEEITMREDYGCQLPPLPHEEEGFGDLGFGDSEPLEMIRDGSNVNHSLEPVSQIIFN